MINNWICGLAVVGLIASGCSGVNLSRSIRPRDVASNAAGAESFQEVWIIERDSKVANAFETPPEPGGLKAVVHGQQREMPLKHMDVNASMNGYISTVDVRQEFENPCEQKIEAVYVFSLPDDAAVDDFVMTIGKRRIRGIIRERKEAKAIYEEAKRQGYLTSLLTAGRANIFRQTIANIEPGKNVDVRLHYFQTLPFEDGWYEFLFPTAFNTKGSSGHGNVSVSLKVDVNAGTAIADLQCPGHAILKQSLTPEHWTAQTSPGDGFPNEDFKLRFRLAGGENSPRLMTYRDERGGYFTLLLHAPTNSSLTDTKIDWGAMQVSEIYSRGYTNIPAGRAVMLAGRFAGSAPTTLVVTGTTAGQSVSFAIPVDSSKTGSEHVIPKIWASMKIAALARQSVAADDLEFLRATKQVALDYGLASPFTAILAVDALETTEDVKTISVPAVP